MKKSDKFFKSPSDVVSSVKAAKIELVRNYRYIEKHFDNFPSIELSILLDRNFQLLSVIGKNESCMF